MVKIIRFLRKNSPRQISYVGICKISTVSHQSPPITNISTQTMAPQCRAAKATLKATGGKTTRNDDGDRRHDNSKVQHGDGRHNDGDGQHDDAVKSDRQHDDGNVQQDNMRHDDGNGRHEDAAR